jgi:hypothetical protein
MQYDIDVSANALCVILEECVGVVLKADGDRDYMNPSNLSCQQTQAIADYMRLAIKMLDAR